MKVYRYNSKVRTPVCNKTLKCLWYLTLLSYLIPSINESFLLFHFPIYLKYVSLMLMFITLSICFINKPFELHYITVKRFRILTVMALIMMIGVLSSNELGSSLLRSLFTATTILCIISTNIVLGYKQVFHILETFLLTACSFIVFFSFYYWIFSDHNMFHLGNFRGVFINSNTFGTLLGIFIIPVALINFIRSRGLLVLLLIVSSVVLLFISNARASALCLIILLSFVFFYHYIYRKKMVVPIVSLLVIVFVCGTITLNKASMTYIETYVSKPQSSTCTENSRSAIWNKAIVNIEKKPLLGWGFGVNPDSVNQNSEVSSTEKGSFYLGALEEFGLFLGSILIFCVLYIVFVTHMMNLRLGYDYYRYIYLGIIAVSLIDGLFESWLFYLGSIFSLLWWMVVISLIFYINDSCTVCKIVKE